MNVLGGEGWGRRMIDHNGDEEECDVMKQGGVSLKKMTNKEGIVIYVI